LICAKAETKLTADEHPANNIGESDPLSRRFGGCGPSTERSIERFHRILAAQ
jgi:hypothetical protein